VGMGKTHLLQAIAHACIARGLRALYIPSEVFTNDLIDAIRNRSTAMFRERYRSADVLLVDDIQFMAGKESTQEEFFHTFNALVTYNKQVVLASDRPPHLLATLEDRLRSRFAGGLVVDIQPADLETRIAILQLWAQERAVDLPIETAEALAMRAPNNCRELEGVFNQLVAKARLNRGALTVDAAYATVEAFERPREYLTLARLLDATARYYGVTTGDLTGQKRSSRINTARQVAMFLARDLLELSLTQIGEAFGGRSHSTVLHGCNKMAEELDHDTRLRSAVDLIKRQLKK
jgi:chromosomal replication initiator protein